MFVSITTNWVSLQILNEIIFTTELVAAVLNKNQNYIISHCCWHFTLWTHVNPSSKSEIGPKMVVLLQYKQYWIDLPAISPQNYLDVTRINFDYHDVDSITSSCSQYSINLNIWRLNKLFFKYIIIITYKQFAFLTECQIL